MRLVNKRFLTAVKPAFSKTIMSEYTIYPTVVSAGGFLNLIYSNCKLVHLVRNLNLVGQGREGDNPETESGWYKLINEERALQEVGKRLVPTIKDYFIIGCVEDEHWAWMLANGAFSYQFLEKKEEGVYRTLLSKSSLPPTTPPRSP